MTHLTPTPEEKAEALGAFKQEFRSDIEQGIQNHEQTMTRLGFLFLAIFVGVVALAAVLP